MLPTILVDTREKQPYAFRASKTCAGCEIVKLNHGDYQLKGAPEIISIERKHNIDELCGCIGRYRQRFVRELERMQDSYYRYVVIEDYWSSIFKKKFSKLSSNAIVGSIFSLELRYDVHFIFCGNRKMGHRITRELLIRSWAEWQKE